MEIKECIEILGDWAAIVTAVLALFVSIRSLKLQKKHNELSLMPICEMYTANFDNDLSVEVHNKGLGLMGIIEVEFADLRGVRYKNLHDIIWYEEGISYNTLPPKKVLMSGEKVRLVSFSKLTDEQRQRIITTLSNINVHIRYRDVYNNEYSFEYPIGFD